MKHNQLNNNLSLFGQFDTIAFNWENGNLTDAKEQIRKLSKYQIILLVEYWASGGSRMSDVVKVIKSALEE
jgi:hypothetical protein